MERLPQTGPVVVAHFALLLKKLTVFETSECQYRRGRAGHKSDSNTNHGYGEICPTVVFKFLYAIDHYEDTHHSYCGGKEYCHSEKARQKYIQ